MQAGDLISSDRQGRSGNQTDIDQAWSILHQVMDPEVPVISVTDLGIIREVSWLGGHLQVVVTPTYSGCPATEYIERAIYDALVTGGFEDPQVRQQLDPAWTTDWITDKGREQLREYGIAPPVGSASKPRIPGEALEIPCPHCGSKNTVELTEFGSTACKALHRCNDCLEPFDYFKCI